MLRRTAWASGELERGGAALAEAMAGSDDTLQMDRGEVELGGYGGSLVPARRLLEALREESVPGRARDRQRNGGHRQSSRSCAEEMGGETQHSEWLLFAVARALLTRTMIGAIGIVGPVEEGRGGRTKP